MPDVEVERLGITAAAVDFVVVEGLGDDAAAGAAGGKEGGRTKQPATPGEGPASSEKERGRKGGRGAGSGSAAKGAERRRALSRLERSARRLRIPLCDREWVLETVMDGQLLPSFRPALAAQTGSPQQQQQQRRHEQHATRNGGGHHHPSPKLQQQRQDHERQGTRDGDGGRDHLSPQLRQQGQQQLQIAVADEGCLMQFSFGEGPAPELLGSTPSLGLSPHTLKAKLPALGQAGRQAKERVHAQERGQAQVRSLAVGYADYSTAREQQQGARGGTSTDCSPAASPTVHGKRGQLSPCASPRAPAPAPQQQQHQQPIWQLDWLEPAAVGPTACMPACAHRRFYSGFTLRGGCVRVKDCVELAPQPGEPLPRVVRLDALWSEKPSDGRPRMYARCVRFYRPQVGRNDRAWGAN